MSADTGTSTVDAIRATSCSGPLGAQVGGVGNAEGPGDAGAGRRDRVGAGPDDRDGRAGVPGVGQQQWIAGAVQADANVSAWWV
jgi:hypothetical protein